MTEALGFREIGDLMLRPLLFGTFGGGIALAALLHLLTVFEGHPASIDLIDIAGSFVGALIFIPLFAGPVILASLATFGALAVMVVNRLGTPQYISLALILAFATMPIVIFGLTLARNDGPVWDALPSLLVMAGPFAFVAALSLWHEMLKRKRRIEGSTPS